MLFGVSMSLCRGQIGEYRQGPDPAGMYMLALDDFVRVAREHNFDAVELVSLPVIHTGILSRVSSKIRQAIKGFGWTSFHLPLGEINIAALHPGIRSQSLREMRRTIELCARLGIKQVVSHPGNFGSMPDIYLLLEDLTRAVAEKSVLELAEQCRELDIGLAVENLHRNEPLFQKPAEFKHLLDAGVGFVLDTVHAYEAGVDPVEFIDTYEKSLKEVHLTDGVLRDAVSHLPIGAGEVDCIEVLRRLQSMDFGGPIIFEVESVRDLEESISFVRRAGFSV